MNEGNESKAGNIAGIIVLVIVLYILSIGPMAAIFPKPVGVLKSALVTFYGPVLYLAQNSDAFAKLLMSYLKLWGA